jgi:NitT/TauT family transport system substrate-binding protein
MGLTHNDAAGSGPGLQPAESVLIYRKFLSRRCLLVGSAALGFAPRARAQAATKLAVGITSGSAMLPPFVARDQGLFSKHGLDVTLTQLAFVGLMPPALVGGTIQIGDGTAPTVLQADSGGLDLVVICGETRQTRDNPTAGLMVKPGGAIKTPADLVGKKVGMTGVNGIFDQLFHKWLITKGVDPTKVQIVELAFPRMHDALRSGAVDAVAVVEPFRSRIVADDTGVLLANFVGELNPDILDTFWMASAEWAKANMDTVTKFRAAISDAMAFIAANHDQAKAIEQKATGVTAAFTPTFSTVVKPEDMDFFIQMGKQLGLLTTVPDPKTLILQ